jgi:phage head maturation protease
MSKIVTRNAFVRNTTAEMTENRQFEFIISSEAVDTYRTVFKVDGWDLQRYEANPIVSYQHSAASSDPDDIVGTSTIRIEGGNLIGVVTFEDAEINPKAEKVFRKIQAGTLKMASINARPSEYRYGDVSKGEEKDVLYFTRQELMEWSIVSIGSNPDAHKRNAQTIEELRTAATKDIVVDADIIENTRTVQEAQMIINNNRF